MSAPSGASTKAICRGNVPSGAFGVKMLCPEARPECRVTYPGRTTVSRTHHVHCHLYGEGESDPPVEADGALEV